MNKRMKIPLFQVDAFATKVFRGNPAAVCILDKWLQEDLLQSIAEENNLSETAFVVLKPEGLELRWFTPCTEVDLCGHATLAAGFVLFEYGQHPADSIDFQTRKSGTLTVLRKGELLEMDLPARPVMAQANPSELQDALRMSLSASFVSQEDLLVVLDSEASVRECKPDFKALEKIECRGVIITAPGDKSDFVSRFFAPRVGIPEDPVTGSAHCVLAPYWAKRLGKSYLHAFQVSKRGGELFCRYEGERVKISGKAVLYFKGIIEI